MRMDFQTFLNQFKRKLTNGSFKVFYESNKLTANQNEILFGRGEIDNGGLILNNKRVETDSVSVSQLIMDTTEEEIKAWEQRLVGEPILYIEDMSADTCLSIIVLFARWSAVSTQEIPSDWISYVNRWEKGDVKSTGEPRKSWGTLLNTLSHKYFFLKSDMFDEEKIRTGLNECLLFTIELLMRNANPADVPILEGSVVYSTAITKLNIDYQEYKEVLDNSEKIQLRLPVKGSDRKILVDAIIVTELSNVGTLKNFARNDQDHSWLKSGFGLMAVYSPTLASRGGEITFSVDPSIGVHLEDLWTALEQEEDRKWAGMRPNNKPRSGSDFNQPWHVSDDKTLVAAPYLVEMESGQYEKGSKLSWEETLDQLWRLYHPSSELSVHSLHSDGTWGPECTLQNCGTLYKDRSKQFMGVKWALNKKNSVLLTPTLERHLVALLSGNNQNEIVHLPSKESFDFVDFPGGFCLIHQNGVVVFDDWSRDQTDIVSYHTEFVNLLKRYDAIKKFQMTIEKEIELVLNKLQDLKKIRGELVSLSDSLAKIKIQLRKDIFQTMPSVEDYHLEEFRKTIEKRWGLNTQLNELYDTVSEIEITIKSMVETRTNKVISGITIYGFPFAVLASIFAGTWEDIFTKQEISFDGLFSFFALLFISINILKKIIDKDKV